MRWSTAVLVSALVLVYLLLWWVAVAGLLSEPAAPAGAISMSLVTGFGLGLAFADWERR